MKLTTTFCRHGRKPRSGFTLVELLVVLAIIAVLVALAAAGTFQVIANQRQSNTEATMRTVMKVLNQHWEHVIADAKKENMPSSFLAAYGGNLDQARKDWIKLRLIEAFPQDSNDINNVFAGAIPYNNLSPKKYNPIYKSKIGALSVNSWHCILLALSVSRGGTSLAPESLGSGQTLDPVTKLPMLVDGWGNPIVFSRQAGANYLRPLLQSAGPDGVINPLGDDIISDNLGVK